MLFSKEKLADLKEREDCLRMMNFCITRGFLEEAKEFGKLSRFYGERIKKDDYTELDRKWETYHKLITI